ncbi:MAG: OmpH family outer membrane protein [Deltaproteobacteria bacterium]|nr:OmpH family outer membrane protein [Deltaproteobacteria bacterium]MBI3296406.1 OmpH family outer membrane protein [Deltaproteobacteria bacterium]
MKALVAFLGLASVVLAAEAPASFKVGYVDLQKAMQTVDAGKTAKADLEKEIAAKKVGLEKRQAQLQKEAEAFEKQVALLDGAKKLERQQELQKKFAEFQKEAQETQMQLQGKERELTQPILSEMRAIIEGLGKENNFQLIVEKNEGAVLYAEAGADLTQQLIEKFNAKKKEKKK